MPSTWGNWGSGEKICAWAWTPYKAMASGPTLPEFALMGWVFMSSSSPSLVHLELTFVQGDGYESNFIFLHMAIQFSQHHLLKILSFPLFLFYFCVFSFIVKYQKAVAMSLSVMICSYDASYFIPLICMSAFGLALHCLLLKPCNIFWSLEWQFFQYSFCSGLLWLSGVHLNFRLHLNSRITPHHHHFCEECCRYFD